MNLDIAITPKLADAMWALAYQPIRIKPSEVGADEIERHEHCIRIADLDLLVAKGLATKAVDTYFVTAEGKHPISCIYNLHQFSSYELWELCGINDEQERINAFNTLIRE